MFNEENYIEATLSGLLDLRIHDHNFHYEIIIIDDASTDKSFQKIESLVQQKKIIYKKNSTNLGKGMSVQEGIKIASGNYILIQDADNEYSPQDIPKMLKKIKSGSNQVIYGSRYLNANGRRIFRKFPGQNLGAWGFACILPIYIFLVKKVWISDPLTGYKIYPAALFQTWSPTTRGFETDHEITCHLVNRGYELIEVPVSYKPRSKKEGKKIGLTDAAKAVRVFWTFRDA